MHDLRFYENVRDLTVGELAEFVSGRLDGNSSGLIVTIGPPETAERGALCFLDQSLPDGIELSSSATACLVTEKLIDQVPEGVSKIVVERPRLAFADATKYFLSRRSLTDDCDDLGQSNIHEAAIVAPGAIISAGVEIGEGSVVSHGAVIGPGVRVGRNCQIGPGVVLEAALVGNDVRIKANSVIGGDGFCLMPGTNGLRPVPHFGRVIIQDNVGLGSCVTVDRGALSDTVIGEGSQIDNHVHIGHNVQIGRHCVIAAFGGLSGSVVVEDGVQMGGRVGIADHVRIGARARLAADAAIMRDIPAGETWGGSPARPLRQWMKETAWLAKSVKARSKTLDSDNG